MTNQTRKSTIRLIFILATIFPFFAPAVALAVVCGRAASEAELALCANPQLMLADAKLNRLYTTVYGALPEPLRKRLRDGQRAWIVSRDRNCFEPRCVENAIAERRDILTALSARISDANGNLMDLNGIWLEGTWQVGSILPSEMVAAADLPLPGSVLSFRPGEVCINGVCSTFAIERQDLADGPGREVLPALLGKPSTAPYYLVYINGRASYALTSGPDGVLVALSPGCAKIGNLCTFLQQSWTPKSAESALHQKSAGP
jgi:uncharacterized protein YecT (DUF1311 family)